MRTRVWIPSTQAESQEWQDALVNSVLEAGDRLLGACWPGSVTKYMNSMFSVTDPNLR